MELWQQREIRTTFTCIPLTKSPPTPPPLISPEFLSPLLALSPRYDQNKKKGQRRHKKEEEEKRERRKTTRELEPYNQLTPFFSVFYLFVFVLFSFSSFLV